MYYVDPTQPTQTI